MGIIDYNKQPTLRDLHHTNLTYMLSIEQLKSRTVSYEDFFLKSFFKVILINSPLVITLYCIQKLLFNCTSDPLKGGTAVFLSHREICRKPI